MAVTQVVTRQIADNAITTVKILAANVTLPKLVTLTKGDLITSTGAANAALPVGSNGQILTADSAQADGIKWADPTIVAASFVFNEVPSGTVNGSNATFTLANTPIAGTVRVHVNGLRQKVGTGSDYTISGATITFEAGTAIPVTGDQILCDYMK